MNNGIESDVLEERIAILEEWLKIISTQWYGAESLEQLIKVIKQIDEYKKRTRT